MDLTVMGTNSDPHCIPLYTVYSFRVNFDFNHDTGEAKARFYEGNTYLFELIGYYEEEDDFGVEGNGTLDDKAGSLSIDGSLEGDSMDGVWRATITVGSAGCEVEGNFTGIRE